MWSELHTFPGSVLAEAAEWMCVQLMVWGCGCRCSKHPPNWPGLQGLPRCAGCHFISPEPGAEACLCSHSLKQVSFTECDPASWVCSCLGGADGSWCRVEQPSPLCRLRSSGSSVGACRVCLSSVCLLCFPSQGEGFAAVLLRDRVPSLPLASRNNWCEEMIA